MKFISILCSLLVVGFLAYPKSFSFLMGSSVAIDIAEDEGFLTIESDKLYVEYDLGDEVEYNGFRILDFSKANYTLKQFGIHYNLGLLNDSDYQTFEAIEASGSCPAAFLNEHAEMLLLVVPPNKESILNQSLNQGDRVSVSGAVLTFAYGEMNGHTLDHMNLGTESVTPILISSLASEKS